MQKQKNAKKNIIKYIILLIIFAVIGVYSAIIASAISIGPGSDKAAVKEVQQKLKSWGFYSGEIDGHYGQTTVSAVQKFQKKHGLAQDGIVGNKTASMIGISAKNGNSSYLPSSNSSQSDDVYLLAKCIYGEARGENYTGKVAVGAVILNRVNHPEFPDTIAGVIYQPWAFSVVADGQINLTPDESSLKAARDALNGWDPTGGCIFYYNPAKTNNAFIISRPKIITIGAHIFCM